MDDVVISVENISKSFGGVNALQQVSMTVRRGEIHCLAGENGSGKSTLIKVISGYYRPDSGTIRIDGRTFTSLTPAESIRHGVQVIYQDFSLFPNLSVMENLALNAEVARGSHLVSYRRMRETAQQAVEKIGLDVDMNARVADLSVADRQMIAIARALAHKAKVVIMDEATASLTRKEVNRLFDVIHAMRDEGVAVVFVSHKLDEVFEISDAITIFRNGKNVVSCPANEMDEARFSYCMTGRENRPLRLRPGWATQARWRWRLVACAVPVALKTWTSSCAGEKFWALRGSWVQAVPSWPWHSLACGPSRAASCAWGASP